MRDMPNIVVLSDVPLIFFRRGSAGKSFEAQTHPVRRTSPTLPLKLDSTGETSIVVPAARSGINAAKLTSARVNPSSYRRLSTLDVRANQTAIPRLKPFKASGQNP